MISNPSAKVRATGDNAAESGSGIAMVCSTLVFDGAPLVTERSGGRDAHGEPNNSSGTAGPQISAEASVTVPDAVTPERPVVHFGVITVDTSTQNAERRPLGHPNASMFEKAASDGCDRPCQLARHRF